jgi:hypothetical protein
LVAKSFEICPMSQLRGMSKIPACAVNSLQFPSLANSGLSRRWVRSTSGNDGRKLFNCGAQRARIQGPRCNEPVRKSTIYTSVSDGPILIIPVGRKKGMYQIQQWEWKQNSLVTAIRLEISVLPDNRDWLLYLAIFTTRYHRLKQVKLFREGLQQFIKQPWLFFIEHAA